MNEKEPDFEKIAAQLANPSGEEGTVVANRMNESNGEMTLHTIGLLNINDGDRVLELGPGNAKFASYVLEKANDVCYFGGDISTLMIDEAKKNNQSYCEAGMASFRLLDGISLPFESQFFHKIFTVNTLYFWENPAQQLDELYRVLKPGGILCIAIRSRNFMETLPFTKYGFTLYSPEEGMELFQQSSFQEISYTVVSAAGETFSGEPVVKEDVFFILRKSI
ncbi:MAG TPA: class I SAM-dependent methyltransferase [Pseudosphingobacterium sp.]|nr:class I SAM-dependent methyltransferase [Pseudosphingobacterium sp.]